MVRDLFELYRGDPGDAAAEWRDGLARADEAARPRQSPISSPA